MRKGEEERRTQRRRHRLRRARPARGARAAGGGKFVWLRRKSAASFAPDVVAKPSNAARQNDNQTLACVRDSHPLLLQIHLLPKDHAKPELVP